jgi:general secretion pathway protein J
MRPLVKNATMGFTLIEMLLAIAIMALMAGLSWRGLDAMAQSKRHNEAYREQVLALQASFAQWSTDLDAMQLPNAQTALEIKPGTLRFVRQAPINGSSDTGYVVVAYAKDARPQGVPPSKDRWVRWQSTPFSHHLGLTLAWAESGTWLSNTSDASAPTPAVKPPLELAKIESWRLRFFVDGQWQEQAPAAQVGASTLPYDAVRLELELAQGQALAGLVTRDWIAPRAGGTR